MKKIIYIPLDDRPCNSKFIKKMWGSEDISLISLPQDILGYKKEPAILDKIEDYIIKNVKDADGIVLSIDMLLYGGIVPSRLHYFSIEMLKNKLQVIKKIKEINPSIIIYAFQLIMRNPQYNSDDEEPFYYQNYGKAIFQSGYFKHKLDLGILTEEERKEYEALNIKDIYLNDYLSRREINLTLNLETLNYVKEGLIDYLVIPSDDTSIYGYCSLDKKRVRDKIIELDIKDKVITYPGADEVGIVLTSRMVNTLNKSKPNIYVKYFPSGIENIVQKLEDMPLCEVINSQITSSGSNEVLNELEADIILVVSGNDSETLSSTTTFYEVDYYKNTPRRIDSIIKYVKEKINDNQKVALADITALNGGERKLVQALDREELIFKLAGYSGWNTSSNSIGCAIGEAVLYYHFGNTYAHKSFLALRYLEDVVYGGSIKFKMTKSKIMKYGCNYFHTDGKNGKCATLTKNLMNSFVEHYFENLNSHCELLKVEMPWSRMFEVDIDCIYKE